MNATSIPVRCPCGARLRAPTARAGKAASCPKCGGQLAVPGWRWPPWTHVLAAVLAGLAAGAYFRAYSRGGDDTGPPPARVSPALLPSPPPAPLPLPDPNAVSSERLSAD